MKKKTIIIESIILISAVIVLALFLGLPQVLDLDKRQNTQKNISQLTELTQSTNNFLDKYKFSMTASLSRLKEKIEYSQRLVVPGNTNYKYHVYGGVKDADLRYLVSYDLFNILNSFSKLNKDNRTAFNNAVNSYLITAKSRLSNSPDAEKYQEYISYLDLLSSKLSDRKYFKSAKYMKDINNASFNSQDTEMFKMLAQAFTSSELFKNRTEQVRIIIFLSYINQVDDENASAETFNKYLKDFQKLFQYTSYYTTASGNTFAEGLKGKDIKAMFTNEFDNFFINNINYTDRLNKGVIVIASNVADFPEDRVSNEIISGYVGTSFQQEINAKLDKLISDNSGDSEALDAAILRLINEYRHHDIQTQVDDISEAIFNYLQYHDYLYKSIYKQMDNRVNAAFDEKFIDMYQSYIIKFDQVALLSRLNQYSSIEVKKTEKLLISRFKNNNLLKDFRNSMKKDSSFLSQYFNSKDFSKIVKRNRDLFINGKTSALDTKMRTEKLTIENIKANIDNKKIIKDSEYTTQMKTKKSEWENEFKFILYTVSKANPKVSTKGIPAELLADSLNLLKVNKNAIAKFEAQINESQEKYIKSSYKKYASLFSYVDYCANELVKTISQNRQNDIVKYQEAIVNTAKTTISTSEKAEFGTEFVSAVRDELNDIYKSTTYDFATLTPEIRSELNSLNAKLTNYDEYKKYVKAKKKRVPANFTKSDIESYRELTIDTEGLVYFYNYYMFYMKDKLDKIKFYKKFEKIEIARARATYVNDKKAATDQSWEELEATTKSLSLSEDLAKKPEFIEAVSSTLTNYKAYQRSNYKYDNAFNFDGLLSDLSRVENNIKYYRGLIEFPFYDKDESYTLYGRFIEEGKKKLGVAVVVYTDIHNFPTANVTKVRNLGKTTEDVVALQTGLDSKIKTLIKKFRNTEYIHYDDPDYLISKVEVAAKKEVKANFIKELDALINEFVRENY
ncbi:MAG: hypothetical protein B6226_04105 [Candidatus Cloacimonetes bacterium 4572_65]|nr:MAG: hypothetical protein B6226_04105 [Candidatus Cloacimonetes bacterium 4572_65]